MEWGARRFNVLVAVSEINLVVSDLGRSRAFYAALGCRIRPISTSEGEDAVAWMAMDGFAPVSIHSIDFANWWDRSGPTPNAGSTTIDVTFDDPDDADELLRAASDAGATTISPLRNMPWGQAYGIFADPDGYRWGVKTATSGS